MLRLEHAVDDKGRSTAGLPALSSSKRRDVTDHQLRQIYQRALQAEYRNNEQNATSPDGAIDDVTDMEQVVGIPLVGPRIITRLKRLNRNLWFERSDSDSSKTGVYILEPNISGGMEKKFLCGMETELNPEFSVRVVDESGAPKGIISGWRRILMRLIRARLISEPKAFALFGPPSRDSENWARYTQ